MSDGLDTGGDQGKAFARLEAVAGPYQGRRYALTSRVTVIGRGPYADIVLEDALVSRHHVQIEHDGKDLWLTDLGSTNGTFVNDTRLSTPYRLLDGDRIIVGNSVFALRVVVMENRTLGPAQPTPTPPPPSSFPAAPAGAADDDPSTSPVEIEVPDLRDKDITPRDPLPAIAAPEVAAPPASAGGSPSDAAGGSTIPVVASNTFRLRLLLRAGQITLAVQEASRSPIEAPFNAPFSDAEWAAMLQQLEAIPASSLHAVGDLQKRIGQRLYGALLPAGADTGADIHQAFAQAAGGVMKGTGPLALQLWIDADAVAAARWPWELVHDGLGHMVLSDELRLNRYITYFGRREPFEPVDELRVLLVAPRPTDQDELTYYARPDLIAPSLQSQIQADKVRISTLEKPTFSTFKARLEAAQAMDMPYHLVHFDGHGSYFKNYDTSVMCFEDSGQRTQLVPVSKFASALAANAVRMAWVSGTQSGMGVGNDMLTTAGPALIRGGVPAAVVMQSTMPLGAIGAFAAGFYGSLVGCEPVSVAGAKGRRAVLEEGSAPALWFAPSVYLRAADGAGYIFCEEPGEHMMVRRVELTYLLAMWELMAPEARAQHEEGPLEIVGF